MKRSEIENLWEKIRTHPLASIRGESDCWFFGDKNRGHARITYKRSTYSVHRISYLFNKGNPPIGRVIRHTCDMARCFNPAHLLSGTPRDNMMDMYERGRDRWNYNRKKSPFLTWLSDKNMTIADFVRSIPGMSYSTATKWSCFKDTHIHRATAEIIKSKFPDCPVLRYVR